MTGMVIDISEFFICLLVAEIIRFNALNRSRAVQNVVRNPNLID